MPRFDWDAESEQSAKASIYKQSLYMNPAQLQVYLDDLSVIDAAGMMGGMNGKLLHGKESHDIHELVNKLRLRAREGAIEFPAKPVMASVADFFRVPLRLLINEGDICLVPDSFVNPVSLRCDRLVCSLTTLN